MATLLEKVSYDRHSELTKRVEAQLVKSAIAVRADTEPDPMTELHKARQRWCVNVLTSPETWAERMIPGVIENTTISNAIFADPVESPSDAEIETAVNSLITAYSDYVPS